MNRQLSIPVTNSIIESLYSKLKTPEKKVAWLEKNDWILLILQSAAGSSIKRKLLKNY